MKLNEPVKIFPGAQVIGDVEIGENCSIWHGAKTPMCRTTVFFTLQQT